MNSSTLPTISVPLAHNGGSAIIPVSHILYVIDKLVKLESTDHEKRCIIYLDSNKPDTLSRECITVALYSDEVRKLIQLATKEIALQKAISKLHALKAIIDGQVRFLYDEDRSASDPTLQTMMMTQQVLDDILELIGE